MTWHVATSLVNPTSCLPRIKSQPSSTDLFRSLGHLSLLYSPQSLNKDEASLFATISNDEHDVAEYQDALDAAKVDDHERRYAMDWLTLLIGSGLYWVEDDSSVTSADALLDFAGRILGGHASLEEAGAISREFRFPLKDPVVIPEEDLRDLPSAASPEIIEIILRDDPLPPSDTRSETTTQSGNGSSQEAAAAVGVQTWGASIIVSDVLVRHPTLFHPGLARASDPRLRVAELGAGTGLLGMATAKLLQQTQIPAEVVLTDYHTQVLSNLRHNVQENFPTTDDLATSASVTVEPLDWLEIHNEMLRGALHPDRPKYDLLLLADVIYAPEHALWIRSSIEALLRQPSSEAEESTSRAHIVMAVRGTGKFEGLFRTVEDAFRPRAQAAAVPSLSASLTATPLDTMPGTPALTSELSGSTDQKGHASHSALLRSRMDTVSLQQACSTGPQLSILKRRRLDKRSNVGRNDEQEYLWFEVGWAR